MRDFGDAPRTADSRDKGPAGSLRRAISEASPGDVIRFERAHAVQLNAAIRVPSRLRGLTIDGAVGGARAEIRSATGAALDVSASRAVVRNLVFQDAALAVSPATAHGEVEDVQVTGNRFTGPRASLQASSSDGTVVEGNEFDGTQPSGVRLHNAGGARVRDNRFTGAGLAIEGEGVQRSEITGNQLAGGGIHLQMGATRVAGNRIVGGAKVNPLWLRGNSGGNDGVVEGNEVTVAGAAVRLIPSGRMTVRDNRFTGAGRGVVVLGCTSGGRGPKLRFDRNLVTAATTLISCARNGLYELRDNRLTGALGSGLSVAAPDGRVVVRGGEITGNGDGGIAAHRVLGMGVRGTRITGNRGPGISSSNAADVNVLRVAMGGNTGVGIRSPGPPAPVLTYDERTDRIKGRTCASCQVELYASEPPPAIGNPGRGEGTSSLGSVVADRDGRFTFPRKGKLKCPGTGKVTAVATPGGSRSSGFAKDVECACAFVWEFDVDPRDAPRTGFANRGASASFPAGTKFGEVTLTNLATGQRPAEDAFFPQVQWEEVQRDRPGLPPDRVGREWFVQLTWRDRQAPEPTQSPQRWVYRIAYDPPRGCDAQPL